MAANFCSQWLKNNAQETSLIFEEKERIHPEQSHSKSSHSEQFGGSEPQAPNEIVFEDNHFKLVVKSDRIKQNHRFKVVDQQFNLLVIPKTNLEHPPLIEILGFLEEGFNFILKKIKTFINRDEHRIAYLSLYQQPMVIKIHIVIFFKMSVGIYFLYFLLLSFSPPSFFYDLFVTLSLRAVKISPKELWGTLKILCLCYELCNELCILFSDQCIKLGSIRST